MDLTVLDIGLRNHHISSLQCFFKIQTETFASRLSNCSLNDEQKDKIYEDWNKVFTKLSMVISANIHEQNSHKFAICLARIGFQSCNQLLGIIEKTNSDDFQYKKRFKNLFIQSIRSLRLSIRLTNVEESNSSQINTLNNFEWNKNSNQTNVLLDALEVNGLVLGQFWLKRYHNIDNNWNNLMKKVIKLSINSLRNNDFENFKNILFQSGLELQHIIRNIYVLTSDYRLRHLLLSKFNETNCLINEKVNENMSEIIIKIDGFKNDTNISIPIDWISRMAHHSIQRSFFLSSYETNGFDKNILSPNIVWNYLIDKNDCNSLSSWIQRLEAGFESNTFPFNWFIRDDMIESVTQSASVPTKEAILNCLAIRGCFSSQEMKDFQKILFRFGRSDSMASTHSLNGFVDESIILTNSSLKVKEFLKELIEYLSGHKFNDFLYLYHKNFSQIPLICDNNLINLLKSSIRCYEKPSNENILENILLSAQYVYSVPNPVTIKSLFENNYPYLGLICATFSSLNTFELFSQKIKGNTSSQTSDELVINSFRNQFPIFLSSFSELSKQISTNAVICESPTVYNLLMDSIPFDVTKMFCWQSINSLVEINEHSFKSTVFNQLPHFSNTSLADLYGLKANLTFTYYLNQGRVIEAYNQFISNRKSLNSKSIGMAGRRAALVAYNDTNDIQIAVSSVIFQQLLNEDSTQTLVHLSVANIIMSFAADFLSLNQKLQQIELSNLLKRSHYYSDKRAATKLLQLTVTAITRKYKNYMNIQIEECFDWNIVIRFATLHNLELPLDLLTKCAASDNWLLFTICCQLHQYPKESILDALKNFNNECISDHLFKAFQSSHIILADNENADNSRILNRKQSQKRTTKHLRNVLYSRIGLNQRQEPIDSVKPPKNALRINSPPIESDDQSIASETDYNVETISVVSSSNASDNEDIPKLDPQNCPKDLFQIILSFQTDSSADVRKPLLYSCIPLSNPILCLIASSADYGSQKLNIFSCFSCWILSSVDFTIRKQFCQKVVNLDPINWSEEENYQLLDLIMRDTRNYWLFLRGLKLFSLNLNVLNNLLKFMSLFFCEKNYYNVQYLKSFQDSLWKYEQPIDCDNLFQTKQWIQRASVIILTNALRNAKSHELVILLRHYDFARIQDSFSEEIKVEDFRKLYRLSQCLIDTDIVLPVSKLLSEEKDSEQNSKTERFSSVIKSVISSLQQKEHFVEARNLANIAEIESNELIISEWSLRAVHNLNSFDFWEKCWENLTAIDSSLQTAAKLFHKFLSQISSVVVKCFLIFKCLIASQNIDNQRETILLETMLWKCIFQIERDNYEKNHIWSRVWSDIIAYIKSNRTQRFKTNWEPITITSSSEELQKTMNKIMEKLFNNSCIEKSQELSQLFGYNHPDLDIVLTCDNMAKGSIKDLSEAPLSVQLKIKAIGKMKATQLSSHFTEEQKEIIEFIESISNLSTIGSKACQRVLLYFKISCVSHLFDTLLDSFKRLVFSGEQVLNRSYTEVMSSEIHELELLKCLITVHSTTNDSLSFAKELIALNDISDESIASIICRETLVSLKNSVEDYDYSRDNSFSNLVEMSTSFLSLIRLLNDTTILGSKLLKESDNLSNDSNNNLMLTKLYIKAHECFSLACDVRGIALVLRKARLFITQHLLQLRDFKSILRLLTGIGRYSEMTYCFDLLKENNEFELLISKHIEKAPQLRIALLDYLKGDKELFPLVALRFCLYREIGENHEMSAKQQFNDLKQKLSTNLINRKQELENIMNELIDAHESYSKAGCYSKGDTCGKLARLIALQIHYLPNNVILINMNSNQISNFIENNRNFHEALIVAEAYDYNTGWVSALFNQFILNNDSNYLIDYTSRRDISTSLAEELVNKYVQYISQKNLTNEKLSQMKKSMQKLLQYIEDYELRFRIGVKLNFSQINEQMLNEESGTYLQDLRRNGLL